MDYAAIYEAVQSSLNSRTERVWKTRSWSVLLAGASFALNLQSLTYSEASPNAIISNPLVICSFIITGSTMLNLGLWIVSITLSRDIIRLGTYIWALEERACLPYGWEHWLLFSKAIGIKTFRTSLTSDIQFWLAISYFVAGTILIVFSFSLIMVIPALCSFICLFIGFNMKKKSYDSRKKIVKDMSIHFENPSKWYSEIERVYNVKLPRNESTE